MPVVRARVFMVVLMFVCILATANVAEAAGEPGPVLTGTVTKVVDADTIDVQLSSGPIRIRLHGIDANLLPFAGPFGRPWPRPATPHQKRGFDSAPGWSAAISRPAVATSL
jgi:hypothetical protein